MKARKAKNNLAGRIIDHLFDSKTGKYYIPFNPYEERMRNRFMELHHVENPAIKVGILDSGMMYNHPLIRDAISGGVDFTGEGLEDQNGHGTVIALITLKYAKFPIYNIKVMDKDLRSCEDFLLDGLIWAEKNGMDMLNISIGRSVKERCKVDNCRICSQIKKMVTESNINIFVAAGNDPNLTYCPACSDHVITVGALNGRGDAIAHYSHEADFYEIGTFGFREFE